MESFTPVVEDLARVLKDIERRIQLIDIDMRQLDSLVERDIRNMLAKYAASLSPDDRIVFFDDFKEKHMKVLKEKKKDSLERARQRLRSLQEELLKEGSLSA